MLRNLLLITSGGVVVFSKEFFNPIAQPRMVGSLIVAMLEFSSQTTGLQLSYIELTNVGITIVGSEASKMYCMLFHDMADGEEFGQLLASEILLAFLSEYSAESISGGRNLNSFNGFHYKLAAVVRKAVRPVLVKLQRTRGVVLAVLAQDELHGSGEGDSIISSSADVDQVGVLANLHAITSASASVMAANNDTVESIWIDSAPSRSCQIVIRRVENATLVVQCSKRYKQSSYIKDIDEAINMLSKVILLGGQLNRAT